MNDAHSKYQKGDRFKNNRTNEQFKILEVRFSDRVCDIVYYVSHYRYKFDMFKISESTLAGNVDSGEMEKLQFEDKQ